MINCLIEVILFFVFGKILWWKVDFDEDFKRSDENWLWFFGVEFFDIGDLVWNIMMMNWIGN